MLKLNLHKTGVLLVGKAEVFEEIPLPFFYFFLNGFNKRFRCPVILFNIFVLTVLAVV